METVGSLWGTEEFITVINPAWPTNAEFVRTLARRFRASATPRNAAAQYQYILENVDVRSVLHLIQAPTLVLHTSHNPMVPIDHGRYLADHIPGAKFVEVPGDGIVFDDGEDALVVEEIAEFLTGERPVVDVDRVLTTVLFTDIVASTEHLASLGDRRWSAMLDAHDRAVREQLRRFRGREINTTGDGFAACFDGPGRAIACATSITQAARELGIEVRAGLHTGECEVRGDDLAGLAVHLAARIGSLAGPGEVLVSTTVKDLVAGSGIEFVDRGEHELKGIPTTWRLFAVADSAWTSSRGHNCRSATRATSIRAQCRGGETLRVVALGVGLLLLFLGAPPSWQSACHRAPRRSWRPSFPPDHRVRVDAHVREHRVERAPWGYRQGQSSATALASDQRKRHPHSAYGQHPEDRSDLVTDDSAGQEA